MATDSNIFPNKQRDTINQDNCIGFEKTMQLMNSLLIELDKKSLKLRYTTDNWKKYYKKINLLKSFHFSADEGLYH